MGKLAFRHSFRHPCFFSSFSPFADILKQQGHFHDLNAVAFSPNGQLAATGGDDGKLKIWNTATGFCFVTFTEHTAPITAVTFMGGKGTGHGLAVVSASLDGTVRAFDLVRYRNFRTFTPAPGSPPVQFTCLAVDEGGELVMAAGMEPFGIHVWSVQTGKLLDVLSGHEGPISSLSYSTASGLLASSSWDKTVKLWDLYGDGAATETLRHNSDALAVAFRPDGLQLAVATLDGILHFWDAKKGVELGTIDARRDAAGGRKVGDATKLASSSTAAKCFNSIAYTADGECLLAGGRSKYACLYAITPKLLLRKWQISHNRSLDGILDKLSGKDLGEAGNMALLDLDDAEDPDKRRLPDPSLPGAKRGDMASKRNIRQEVRAKCLCFSPTGRSFAIATTEGLLLYSLDEAMVFDPFELGEDTNPDACQEALEDGQFVKALLVSLHLNEGWLIVKVLEALPVQALSLLFSFVPSPFLARLIDIIASKLHPTGADRSPHVEFFLRALLALLTAHSKKIRDRPTTFAGSLRSAQRALVAQRDALAKMIDSNAHTLAFLAEGFGGLTDNSSSSSASAAASSGDGDDEENKASLGKAVVEELDDGHHSDDDDDDDEGWIVPTSSSSSAAAGAGKTASKSAAAPKGNGKGKSTNRAGKGGDGDDDDDEAYKQPAVKSMVSKDYEDVKQQQSASSSAGAAVAASNNSSAKAKAPVSGSKTEKTSQPPPAKKAKKEEKVEVAEKQTGGKKKAAK
jgi:periodic tryptophan protein 2